jgi:hypothetical protein
VEIDLHFVRERVSIGVVRVLHVPTTSQFTDVFTKGLPSSVFIDFRSSLNVRSTDVPTAGGVKSIYSLLVCAASSRLVWPFGLPLYPLYICNPLVTPLIKQSKPVGILLSQLAVSSSKEGGWRVGCPRFKKFKPFLAA